MQNKNNEMLVQLSTNDLFQLITEAVKQELNKITEVIKRKPIDSEKETELLNREETSKLLKISFTTLWKHSKSGLLPSKKLGNKVYYFRKDVYNHLNTAS